MSLSLNFVNSILQINQEDWQKLAATESPFLQHEFLSALELSSCIGEESGWIPHHLTVSDGDTLIAAVPMYLKTHSYGEYVFDFAWAQAYQQRGMDYYPKLVAAIPFTPVTGSRLLLSKGVYEDNILSLITSTLDQYCNRHNISSVHWLFTQQSLCENLQTHNFLKRSSVQFQWFNHSYSDFDDFLVQFTSRKRKNVRKERNKLKNQGIVLARLCGNALTPAAMEYFYQCYQQTYLKRSGHGGYLTLEFFMLLLKKMPDNLLLVMAYQQDVPIAAALYIRDEHALYGRYWGCLHQVDGLHFECCYYQGIEYCIEHGLKTFNPGTQGEHKIQRGFEPIYCYSNHWLADSDFQHAIRRYLQQEHLHIAAYKKEAETLLPFKNGNAT